MILTLNQVSVSLLVRTSLKGELVVWAGRFARSPFLIVLKQLFDSRKLSYENTPRHH